MVGEVVVGTALGKSLSGWEVSLEDNVLFSIEEGAEKGGIVLRWHQKTYFQAFYFPEHLVWMLWVI